ncbi:VanW family protein [Propioniciclava soli]|uniref:VanW family protein n=1 Tax=Propioniciclava soli TaxID=2775081 RepID=A0ABZ3C5I8_9ACTN
MTADSTDVTEPARRRRRGPLYAALAGGTLLLLGGAYGVGYALSGETLPPNTTIEGVEVGRLAAPEAETRLSEELTARAEEPMTLASGEEELTRTPAEFGLSVDYAASVAEADVEKSFNPVDIWNSLTGGRSVDAVVARDEPTLEAVASELAQLTNADPVNAGLVIEANAPVVQEGSNGRALDVAATADAVADAYLDATRVDAVVAETEPEITTAEAEQARDTVAVPALSGPVTIQTGDRGFQVTPEMIGASLSFVPADGALAPELNAETLLDQAEPAMEGLGLQQAKDATIELRDGTPVVVPGENGLGVAKEDLARAVGEAMTRTDERTGSVTIAEVEPDLTTAEAEALGVREITGEFTTRFPATAYRVNNIGKSAGLINNTLLLPGETFSMNAALGERTLANGWKAGGAIDGGRIVERMGGGISQTTTTLFNAIFFAGLEDVVHKPHSLYFSRYPMGREATLDWNSVEMKFRNDTDYGVLIQAFTNNPEVGGQGTVTVRIWSTMVYDVTATDPVQSNFRSPGETIRSDAAVCSPQSGMRGFTVNFDRVFRQNGAVVRTEPFEWTYNTLTPVVCTNPDARADRIER